MQNAPGNEARLPGTTYTYGLNMLGSSSVLVKTVHCPVICHDARDNCCNYTTAMLHIFTLNLSLLVNRVSVRGL